MNILADKGMHFLKQTRLWDHEVLQEIRFADKAVLQDIDMITEY